MWIVRYALDHRYTIAALALLILIFGVRAARQMPTDILPEVNIPSVNVIWVYPGLPAMQMAARITSASEIAILNNVDDLRQVRSESIAGIGIVRVEFQPNVNLERALAQITSISQTVLRRMPRGTSPPFVIRSNASSTPVLQLVLSSDSLTEAQLYDYARLQLRAQIQTVPGIRLTLPYGGAARQIMVDLNPEALHTLGLTPQDVPGALERGSPTLPAGSLREGRRDMQISLDTSPEDIAAFLQLPITQRGENVILLRDVASVRDGAALQTNLARLDGSSAVSVSLIKLGGASALEIVGQIRARLPGIIAAAPPGTRIEPIFDQSVFVENAIDSILFEAVLVGLLIAAVVLTFLGSWRSSLIVLLNIPLALLASIAGLYLLGYSFNVMTLGGLALAIGLLVDNAVVDVENTNRQIALGKDLRSAILDSAREVVFPEFVSTVSICIVLTPILLLTGLSSWVFTPLALAVMFSMLASFVLSRTLIPVLCSMLMPADERSRQTPGSGVQRLLLGLSHGVERRLESLRGHHHRLLESQSRHSILLALATFLLIVLGGLAAMNAGREYFPAVDAGQLRLHVRVPPGSRLEETSRRLTELQQIIREVIPARQLQNVYEQVGVPDSINLGWIDSAVVGAFEAEVMLQLRAPHGPSARYLAQIRQLAAKRMPDVSLFERPPDATRRTLAGSALGALELRIIGRDVAGNQATAQEIARQLEQVQGTVDVMIRQVGNLPEYRVQIDRIRAAQLGVDAERAARAVLSVLGNAGSVTPVDWIDHNSVISYGVQVQALPHQLPDLESLLNTPVRYDAASEPVLLRSIASASERRVPASVERTMITPTVSIVANVQGTDLGSAYRQLQALATQAQSRLKPGNRFELAGQAREMEQAYGELAGGLLLAATLVFLVLVVNFQSWAYPLIAMSGLPLAIAGAAISLWITGTPLSVPALMGVMMVIGVCTANSVLVVSFARDLAHAGHAGEAAVFEATAVRLRPVLMTAFAMLLGILPMAIGLGEGGEQNAPLGRAVVGGLLAGTPATLVLVPVLLAALARRQSRRAARAPLLHSDHPVPFTGD